MTAAAGRVAKLHCCKGLRRGCVVVHCDARGLRRFDDGLQTVYGLLLEHVAGKEEECCEDKDWEELYHLDSHQNHRFNSPEMESMSLSISGPNPGIFSAGHEIPFRQHMNNPSRGLLTNCVRDIFHHTIPKRQHLPQHRM